MLLPEAFASRCAALVLPVAGASSRRDAFLAGWAIVAPAPDDDRARPAGYQRRSDRRPTGKHTIARGSRDGERRRVN